MKKLEINSDIMVTILPEDGQPISKRQEEIATLETEITLNSRNHFDIVIDGRRMSIHTKFCFKEIC